MENKELKDLRIKIDTIDKQIRDLFKERMNVVKDIKSFKQANNLSTLDKSRENDILNDINNKYSNDELLEYYLELQNTLMKLSKDYQNKKSAN